MATATQLTATATILNGLGLAANANLATSISTYTSQSGVATMANIFTNAYLASNVANVVVPILNGIGSGQLHGLFFLDLYPANITPVVSPGGAISYFGNALPRASGTITNQSNLPFSNGITSFANAFSVAQGYASSVVDTVGSINMLQNKTYGESGLGYGGPVDLVTNGVGANAHILSNIVSSWGTMYDITNLNLIGDPYVFGQNLLNQGLGTYGNLAGRLSATGLDVTDITKIPQNKTTTAAVAGEARIKSPIGEYSVSTVSNVVTTVTVTGNNPNVVIAAYNTVTSSNLQAIVSATQFTSNTASLVTLADYLTLSKVLSAGQLAQVNAMGVTTLSGFGQYLHSRIGQKTFKTWAEIGAFLANVEIPTLAYSNLSAITSNTVILSANTTSTLLASTGTGSGPFGNPVMVDYFGATAGIPYISNLAAISTNYSGNIGSLQFALTGLNNAVYDTYLNYVANIAAPISGNMVTANVANVNSVLTTVGALANVQIIDTIYYSMLNHLATEVSNLQKAGASLTGGTSQTLLSFAQRIGTLGAFDKTGIEAHVVIGNVITNNQFGDTIRAAIAEINNHATVTNNPAPQQALTRAQAQGIPLSTYLSQNK
ncbi:MAG TPA: hypothetical protein VFM18_17345 [Methanosarcina sp.]|nr:hypothetical protein [Methanosarcina sp.]